MNEFEQLLYSYIRNNKNKTSSKIMTDKIITMFINHIINPKLKAYKNFDYTGYTYICDELKSMKKYLRS